MGIWNPWPIRREAGGRERGKAKHGLGAGDLRSHLGSVIELCDLMQVTSSLPELTHKMRELSHMAPKFIFRSKLVG